ncbi:hypothetical protein [Nostoc sp.]
MIALDWKNYINNSLKNNWIPASMIPDGKNADYNCALSDTFYLFAANEADARTIYQVGSNFATSDSWNHYSTLWLCDEIKHSEAFYRMGFYLNPKETSSWHECFKPRDREFYKQIFQSELHIWAALAIDEWNTHREYLQLATQVKPFGLKKLVLNVAADEARHYVYAVYALKASPRELVESVLRQIAQAALQSYPDKQFLFDHDQPNYETAIKSVMQLLQKV